MGDINMGKETFEGKNSLHDRNNWTSRSWKTTLTDAIKKLLQQEKREI